MAQMVRVLKATRFLTNGKANIVFVDVVEIDRGEGPELWSRSLRHVGHETSKGKREIWEPISFKDYEAALAGRREFEKEIGHFSQEILLQKCPTQEMGPSEREREEM
jgi:hypothetical protein